MSYIPDCRTDEYYNQKYLNSQDKEYIAGFDFAAEQADNLFNNLDVYQSDFDIEGEDINLVTFLTNHPKIAEKAQEALADWLEMQRDEMITSMIDSMDEKEYDRIKEAVDAAEKAAAKEE